MKKNILYFLIVCIFMLSLTPTRTYAVSDPLKTPNNFIGIHILFPSEVDEAAQLVNANGGEWGYVVIPMQARDRDMNKWQKFMDDAKRLKVIPIIRVATEGYYKDTSTWRVPDTFDAIDFANFLNSLEWPTQNRYIVLYNEVNRFDEWGGSKPNPEEYADIVEEATKVFKRRSDNFYIIMGGLDNAAPDNGEYMDNFTFLHQIAAYKPKVFDEVDAFSSHSYPNPGFA